jgi:uncharacterized protein with ParB-like and HNH nuclease domain
MNNIDARSKTVSQLLKDVKYGIDYYQREYKWEQKHIEELLTDLENKFLDSFDPSHPRERVQKYPHYFLGSIVTSQRDGKRLVIDGQQRLTSLSLLLIHLHHRAQGRSEVTTVKELIFSEQYGQRSFNLDVPERTSIVEALFKGEDFDATDQPESVQNILARYRDIQESFPDALGDGALPYFVDWLLHNVELVEITAFSDDDAYTIFETMNDRGLSLSPTDMLKGYLLANLADEDKPAANQLWKQRTQELRELGKDEEIDFFKAWLRAKYAETIRERRKGSTNKDFEIIGGPFNKWVRDEKERVGLHTREDFRDFVQTRLARFSRHYARIRRAARQMTPGLEAVRFNGYNEFTLQYPLLLAPLRVEDDTETVARKLRVVATFVDIFIARRIVNFRNFGYSGLTYTVFNMVKDIRDLDLADLATVLVQKIEEMEDSFAAMSSFYLHQQNRWRVHYLLARITHHIEHESGVASSFDDYVSRQIRKPFEVEHIWADKYERHRDEFSTEEEFARYRNRMGGLVLLPRGFNQSLGDMPYSEKVKHYLGQNLLAKSLHPQAYENNPSFKNYIQRSGLPFKPYPSGFGKADLDERQNLYRIICEEIWNPARITSDTLVSGGGY